MTLLQQGGWTRWPTEVPSNPELSVILWFQGLSIHNFSAQPAPVCHMSFPDCGLTLVAGSTQWTAICISDQRDIQSAGYKLKGAENKLRRWAEFPQIKGGGEEGEGKNVNNIPEAARGKMSNKGSLWKLCSSEQNQYRGRWGERIAPFKINLKIADTFGTFYHLKIAFPGSYVCSGAGSGLHFHYVPSRHM